VIKITKQTNRSWLTKKRFTFMMMTSWGILSWFGLVIGSIGMANESMSMALALPFALVSVACWGVFSIFNGIYKLGISQHISRWWNNLPNNGDE
jgi:hypothetical protein